MKILGIDTSCDDTSAAVIEGNSRILSNIVSSQIDIHKKYGGIVPELASRMHMDMISHVAGEALLQAETDLSEIDAIAVCKGPGLIGSLLVGCGFAKAVGYSSNIPVVGVNHLEGHIFAPFLESEPAEFPFVSLIASGGHTSLYQINAFGDYEELGRTRDDAAGEAYDKIAKMMGLSYPGGPVIDRLAADGDSRAFSFPRAYIPESFDFSFSGLKTSVRRMLQTIVPDGDTSKIPVHTLHDLAASFQAAVVDVLVRKVEWVMAKRGVRFVVLTGGVSANSELRRRMQRMVDEHGARLWLPSLSLCTDNAAMIAAAGYRHLIAGDIAGLDLNPKACLPL
ncbi:MAG: tRNA (adenosine(37)-N6)-threonylcarbamoyltransferase complex transferase subunit TsaD [Dissulfurispiraceae bacterium]|jgi:N6-L-threonylcarbamoyladenine synthase|nr:tRNA (adenosine(37)-N6)-threonylcarbamoyltransferase complex transferase subunit TsaD [Dissulfurispiraceae bacterium]